MTNLKQIDMRFWQNNFVLGLSPEERYFYMYLVTNTMTTKCGIYKFNMKVAELETGYSAEVIERKLENFESYGKIVVSKATNEIMIVNWFKHNFKNNKKGILEINKELRNVKNKDFLKRLYNLCLDAEYPVNEIFSGITVPGVEKQETKKLNSEEPEVIVEQAKEIIEESVVQAVDTKAVEELKEAVDLKGTVELKNKDEIQSAADTGSLLGKFMVQQVPCDDIGEEEVNEEMETEEILIGEIDGGILEGTPIAYWGFCEEEDIGTHT